MKFGYARVSTTAQDLRLQIDALVACGCEEIIEEHASGARVERPALDSLLDRLDGDDELVVWRLDRLGRALPHLVNLVEGLGRRGVKFTSLHERIETGSANGKLQFHLFCALAEFERSLIAERTRAGLDAARRQGRQLGRPRALTSAQVQKAREEIEARRETVTSMARLFGVDRRTMGRSLLAELQLG